MLEFPRESVAIAKDIAKKYRKRSSSKKVNAANLYDGHFYEIGYGFDESMKTGNCGMHLHEITWKADCFTFGGSVLYLIAKEAGLNPKLYMASDMKDTKEGGDPRKKGTAGHTFITVDVSKHEKYLVDPHMGLFGKTNFDHERNTMSVYDASRAVITNRTYSSLVEFSEQEYLKKLQENRSPAGGRNLLSATQKVKASGGVGAFVTYDNEKEELSSSLRLETLKTFEPDYDKSIIIDLKTKVSEDGTFDFNDGNLHIYSAQNTGWVNHINPQVPLVFPVNAAQELWGVWDKLVYSIGRKSDVFGMSNVKLETMIRESGFKDDFQIKKGSLADRVVDENSFEFALRQVQEQQQKTVDDFIPRCREDELSYKLLLQDAHYAKEMDASISDENPSGFVFSEKDYLSFIEESFKGYVDGLEESCSALLEKARADAKLKKTTMYHSARKFNVAFQRGREKAVFFEHIINARQSSFGEFFPRYADRCLFKEKFNIDKMSVKDLENGLSKGDLSRAAQKRLFERLITIRSRKDSLFIASYKKGLQKILDQRQG